MHKKPTRGQGEKHSELKPRPANPHCILKLYANSNLEEKQCVKDLTEEWLESMEDSKGGESWKHRKDGNIEMTKYGAKEGSVRGTLIAQRPSLGITKDKASISRI